jgi:hypothetical protein
MREMPLYNNLPRSCAIHRSRFAQKWAQARRVVVRCTDMLPELTFFFGFSKTQTAAPESSRHNPPHAALCVANGERSAPAGAAPLVGSTCASRSGGALGIRGDRTWHASRLIFESGIAFRQSGGGRGREEGPGNRRAWTCPGVATHTIPGLRQCGGVCSVGRGKC